MPFSIERNDLSLVRADAIVVSANENLMITGGVGAVVAKAAGFRLLQAACDEIGFCPTGSAVVTPGFNLPARFVVHAVGPVWVDGASGEAGLLRSAYDNALARAAEVGARSIALPLISAGTYRFPPELSLSIASDAIREFLASHDVEVRLVLYSRDSLVAGLAAYGEVAAYIDDRYVQERDAFRSVVFEGEDRSVSEPRRYEAEGEWGFSGDAFEAPSAPPSAPARAEPPTAAMSAPPASGRAAGLAEKRPSERVAEWWSALTGGRRSERASTPVSDRVEEAAPSPAEGPATASLEEPDYSLADEEAYSSFAMEEVSSSIPLEEHAPSSALEEPVSASYPEASAPYYTGRIELSELLNSLDEPFSTTLLSLIDARGMTDVDVYKRANMSRQLFSKIRGDASYRPTKKTVLALAVALRLNLAETEDLLRRAGFALSHSSKADVIVEYFIVTGKYDIFEINETLYAFDQPLL